ncbi:uncharacterized protein METZ01_LOCUS315144, partial [marine metagenome]
PIGKAFWECGNKFFLSRIISPKDAIMERL